MNQGFFAQVTQATVNLVTSHAGVFNSAGMSMFRTIAVILVIWECYKIAFMHEPAPRLASLAISIALTYSALVFYSTPFPGVGRNLTQIVTDGGADLAQNIDTSQEEQVGAAVANIMGGMSGSAWNIVTNTAAATRYFIIVLALSAVQIVMLGIIAFGFVAVGVLVMIGPVLIPFVIVPHFEWLAMGWFRSLIQYSFYPVIGNAFISVYGTVWMNFFNQLQGPVDSQKMAALLTQVVVLSMAGMFGILKVPQLVAGIFSGSSGLNAMPGIGWWR